MLRNKDASKVGNIMLGGIGAIVIGCLLVFFGLISSAVVGITGIAMLSLGIILGFGGLCMVLGTLIYGLKQEKGDSKETKIVTIRDTTITARFAINRLGETIFDMDYIEFDDPKTKLYIRIAPPDRPPIELKTNQPVWSTCGEGMRGHAHIQGDWLGRFEQVAIPPPTGNPYIK